MQDLIQDYETNGNQFSDGIDLLEARYNYLHDYINDQRENIEELTKLSYASYFAKTMLEDVVGSKFAADNIFKWGLVNFVLSLEDGAIMDLINNYYAAKSTLEDYRSDEQRAEDMYNNAKVDLEKLKAEIQSLREYIAYWQERLPKIYELEEINGAAGASFIAGDKQFNWPLQHIDVASPFGEEREVDDLAPNNEAGEFYYHKGVDLVADMGTSVYAAGDGYATTGESESMGKYVKIEHADGFVTIYMHLSQVFVPNGVQVHRGDNIALSGSTGDSTGPHLHFQLEHNGEALDPIDFL